MKHTFFQIKNFKGIQDLRLEFDAAPAARVITLVGLNESCKTTILEALNFYKHKPKTLESLKIAGYQISDPHDAIPVSRRSNFTDKIEIAVGYELSPKEQKEFAELLEKKLRVVPETPLERFSLVIEHSFVDSKHDGSKSFYRGIPKIRTKREKNFHGAGEYEEWKEMDSWLTSRLPRIVYFPNFLFEFPDRIYLDTAPSEEPTHAFYRELLQHILHSVDPSLDLQKHILDRAKSTDANDVRNLRSVLSKLGGHVTKTVFEAWDRVFKRKHLAKEIRFDVDKDASGLVYLQFQIKDGDDLFAITERSLGFRWFFTFLLLTQYLSSSGASAEGQLFLFDEPASNLHSSAQQQLLESFQRFHPESRIMYTTHSHHLINPRWLESAYVVVNEGLTYGEDDSAYSARESKVVVERYRKFAAAHPDQTTYYQPILDVLEYKPSNLELAFDALFFEGKNDSYTFALAALQLGIDTSKLCFMPGTGSSNLTAPIQLYLGWGRKFAVLLDADKEGHKQKKRYQDDFGAAVIGRILTLEDVDPTLKGSRLEDVVSDAERLAIQQRCYPGSAANKDQYNRALQELLQLGEKDVFEPATVAKFKSLIEGAVKAALT